MKCPNCGETLKDEAKVCFTCGEALPKNEIDSIIDDMIKEDDAQNNKKKINKDNSKSKATTTQSKQAQTKQTQTKSDATKEQADKKPEFGQGVRITGYVNAIVIVVLLISMLFTWFAFGGRGTLKGFVLDQNSGQFMTEESKTMTSEQIEALDPTVEILSFSPKDLIDYGKLNQDAYKTLKNTKGEEKNSFASVIQLIYIKGFYVIGILGLLSILLLVIDKKLKTIEWTRGISVLSIVIIGLNYAAFKIPFFSMFALKARSELRFANTLSAVTLNMNGVNVNNDFYPYNLIEKNAFFVALAACVIWFILSTVLVEMKKDKEFS